jgi:hypothetical protein
MGLAGWRYKHIRRIEKTAIFIQKYFSSYVVTLHRKLCLEPLWFVAQLRIPPECGPPRFKPGTCLVAGRLFNTPHPHIFTNPNLATPHPFYICSSTQSKSEYGNPEWHNFPHSLQSCGKVGWLISRGGGGWGGEIYYSFSLHFWAISVYKSYRVRP